MKVFDMHIHANDSTPCPEQLIRQMEEAGVWGGCVFSNHPIEAEYPGGFDFDTRLKQALDWCRGYEDRLFPVLWVHPNEENIIEKLKIAADAGIVAFKIICDNFYVYEEHCMRVLREIVRLGKPVIFHTGTLWDGAVSSEYNRPVYWESLLDIEGIRFSIAHCSWPWNDEAIATYGKILHAKKCGRNIEMFFDTTPGTPKVYRKDHFNKLYYVGFPTGDNVMFGTDSIADAYTKEWAGAWLDIEREILDDLGVSLENREKMYFDNAMRFFGKSDAVAPDSQANDPDNTDFWTPENPEVKVIIKKWYERLGFPKAFDKEFSRALEAAKLTDAMTEARYDKDCEDGIKNFLYYLFFCEALSKKYEELGIPEEILLDTLSDLVVWSKTWYCVKSSLHLSTLDWLSNHFNARLFKLGRLQFCMGKAECDISKYDVKKGDNVIEIHIPAGDKLTRDAVLDSVKRAREFFKKYFPDFKYTVFTCHSWLLDEKLKDYLASDSNIIKFGDMFDRVASFDSNLLLRYVFRFDTNEINLPYAYPPSAFAQRIKNAVLHGEQFHEVLGVFMA